MHGMPISRVTCAHAPCRLPCRHVALAPCYWVGLCRDTVDLALGMFDVYRDRKDLPVTELRWGAGARTARCL